jgi:hypothetical protein
MLSYPNLHLFSHSHIYIDLSIRGGAPAPSPIGGAPL